MQNTIAKEAFVDNGKIWITLRPPTDAKQSHPRIVSLESVVVGGPR